MSTNKCKIINGQFSWVLQVDGHEILFSGHENAEYFKAHYQALGYNVEMVDTHWQEFHSTDLNQNMN